MSRRRHHERGRRASLGRGIARRGMVSSGRRREVEGRSARSGTDARSTTGQRRVLTLQGRWVSIGAEGQRRSLVRGCAREDLHAGRTTMTTSRRPPNVIGIGCGCIVTAHGHYRQRSGMSGRIARRVGCVASSMARHSLVGVRGRRVDGQGESRSMRWCSRAGDRWTDGWDGRQLLSRVCDGALPLSRLLSGACRVVVESLLVLVVAGVLEAYDAFNLFAREDAAVLPLHVRAHFGSSRHPSYC